MIFRREFLLAALLILLLVAPATWQRGAAPVAAQGSDDTCPAFVEAALEAVGTHCDGLARGEACYGYDRVDATFWQVQEPDAFTAEADRIAVNQLQTVSTAPLNVAGEEWGVAVLLVQASLPETLPGQAVTLMLMGDTRLENTVAPGTTTEPGMVVEAVTLNTSNLRSAPSTDANIVDNVPAGTSLRVIGANEVRNWYEVQTPTGSFAWVWNELVTGVGDVEVMMLPITSGASAVQRYGPMQAFYFNTGPGAADCTQAPDAMIVQTPEDTTVALRINDLDVTLGSTAVFMMADVPNAGGTTTRAMVATLVDGTLHTYVNGARVQLTAGGQAFAVTVNAQGRVDSNSTVITPPGDVVAGAMQNACQNAAASGLLDEDMDAAACEASVAFFNPPTPTPVPVVAVQPTQPPAQQPAAAQQPAPAQPTQAPAAQQPPPAVSGHVTGSFEIGGHVAGLGADTANRMRYAGMTWVKYQVRYNFGADPGGVAGLINEAHALGLKILLGIVGHPSELASMAEQDYYNAYAGYLAGVAALGADAIEVWNEMNIDREWPTGRIDPAMYVRMLAAAYNAIRGANPNTLIISGALAPTGAEGAFGRERVWNDDNYYAGMAAAGAAQYADCIGAHYNEGIVPPSQVGNDPRGDSYPTRFLTTMTDRAGGPFGGQRPVCYTELGYLTPEGYGPLPDGFAWAANVTLAQQAAWLAEAAVINSNSGRVRLMIIWNVNFTQWGADPMAGYAMVRPGGACPACDTLHAVTG